MAYTADASHTETSSAVGARISAFLGTLVHAMEVNSIGYRRLQDAKYLQARTDDELAQMKLARAEIVPHAFRDVMWM